MNVDQLTMLLARIQVLDNRQVDELTIQAWTPLMEDVDYGEAVAAVNAHSIESTEYLKPAHIVQRVRAKRKDALPATMSPEGKDCTELGRPSHEWMDSGYCLFCEQRRDT